MGLDLFAACKFVNNKKITPVETLNCSGLNFQGYQDRKFRRVWQYDARNLVSSLYWSGFGDLSDRLYGDLPGARNYHPDEAIAEMPNDLSDEMLPPLISVAESLALADEIAKLSIAGAREAAAYLKFWANNGHPIFSSY